MPRFVGREEAAIVVVVVVVFVFVATEAVAAAFERPEGGTTLEDGGDSEGAGGDLTWVTLAVGLAGVDGTTPPADAKTSEI